MRIKGDESFPPQTTANEEPTHPRDAWTADWGGLPEAVEVTGLPIDELMSEDPVGETQVAAWIDELDQPHDPTITAEPGEPNPEGKKAADPDELSWGNPNPLDDSGALEAMALGGDQEDDEEDEEEDTRPITERMEAICGDMSTLFQEMAEGLGIDVGVQDPTESRTAYLDRMIQSINDTNEKFQAVVPTVDPPQAFDDTDIRKDNMAPDTGADQTMAKDSGSPQARANRLVPWGLLDDPSDHLEGERFESAPPK